MVETPRNSFSDAAMDLVKLLSKVWKKPHLMSTGMIALIAAENQKRQAGYPACLFARLLTQVRVKEMLL